MEPDSAEPTRLVAFLRAINVGGHNVKMEELSRLFEALGFVKVETFIASGNVIFASPEENHHVLEKDIEQHLNNALGYPVATFIRTVQEVVDIANYQPFPPNEYTEGENSLYIALLASTPGEEARQKLMALSSPVDSFHVHDREVYWLCSTKMSESMFSGALLEKTLRLTATIRNVTTVRKLAAKYGYHSTL